jgi:hypothetical protein
VRSPFFYPEIWVLEASTTGLASKKAVVVELQVAVTPPEYGEDAAVDQILVVGFPDGSQMPVAAPAHRRHCLTARGSSDASTTALGAPAQRSRAGLG